METSEITTNCMRGNNFDRHAEHLNDISFFRGKTVE